MTDRKWEWKSAGNEETSSTIDFDPGGRKLNIGSGLGNKTWLKMNTPTCALGN
jgi:hypothetical protein